MIVKSSNISIKLIQVEPKFDWQLKVWEVYAGKFYLGRIYKRWIGDGTPIVTHKPKQKVFQSYCILCKSESIGYPLRKKGYPVTLVEAKQEFRIIFKKLIIKLLS